MKNIHYINDFEINMFFSESNKMILQILFSKKQSMHPQSIFSTKEGEQLHSHKIYEVNSYVFII